MESVLKIYQIRRFITYSPDLCSLPLFPSLLYNRSSSTAAAWDLKAFPNYHAAHLASQQPTGRCNVIILLLIIISIPFQYIVSAASADFGEWLH